MDKDIDLITRESRIKVTLTWIAFAMLCGHGLAYAAGGAEIDAAIEALAKRVTLLEAASRPQSEPEPDPNRPPKQDPALTSQSAPGVLISRPLKSDAEIDALHFVDSMYYKANDPRSGFFDETINGANFPIIVGDTPSSARNDRLSVPAPTTGRVYAQWDFYVPSSFYKLFENSNLGWSSIKTFRIYNNQKRDVKQNTSGTFTLIPNRGEVWVRDAGHYEAEADCRIKYLPPADTWATHRVTKDYDNLMIEFTATVNGKVVAERQCKMSYLTPIDNIAALIHSTSRDLGRGQDRPTFFGYRNLVLGVE